MGDRFSLDVEPGVEPGVVAAAARRLAERAEHLRGRGRSASSAPKRWASGWSSRTSGTVGQEATTLGGHLTTFAGHFETASAEVSRFADDLDEAVRVEVPDLNRRWAAADQARRSCCASSRRSSTTSTARCTTTARPARR